MVDRNRNITLKDVAKASKVSYQTVSRAVNDLPGINAATRERVLKIAGELGYRRNGLAGSLRTNRSRAIGIVVSDIENTFFAEAVQAAETDARSRGYSVLLATSNEDLGREQEAVRALVERRVDGLIVAPSEGDHDYLVRDLPSGLPLVAINRAIPEYPSGAVLLDNIKAARQATEVLIQRGHRRVGALIGDLTLMTSRERLKGFEEALHAGGAQRHGQWIRQAGLRRDTGRRAALELFGQTNRPTALFTSSNMLTEGALLALRDLGLRQGIDVEIAGFDLGYAELLNPPVPVMRQPTYEIGRKAVGLLIDLVEGIRSPTEMRLGAKLVAEPDLMALRDNLWPPAAGPHDSAPLRK